MKAVQDEIERKKLHKLGWHFGALGGALLGAAVGTVPHKLGQCTECLKDKGAARGMTPKEYCCVHLSLAIAWQVV